MHIVQCVLRVCAEGRLAPGQRTFANQLAVSFDFVNYEPSFPTSKEKQVRNPDIGPLIYTARRMHRMQSARETMAPACFAVAVCSAVAAVKER